MKNILLLLLLLVLAGVTRTLAQGPSSAQVFTSHFHPGNLYPGMSEYEVELVVRGEDISSVTVEGPNVDLTNLEYKEISDSQEWRWTKSIGLPGKPSVGDTYEFHVIYNDSATEDLTASVIGIIEEFPTIISPVHGSIITTTIPTFEWTPLSIELRSFSISVFDVEGEELIWKAENLNDLTSVVYNFDGEGAPLEPGKLYIWFISYN